MLKTTNLDAVKELAYNFLHLDFTPNENWNMFINHPFTNANCFYSKKTKKSLQLIDDSGNVIKEAQNEFYEQVKEMIDESLTYSDVLAHIEKSYKSAFLYHSLKYINCEDLGLALKHIWPICDYVNVDKQISKERYSRLFIQANKSTLMNEKEIEIFHNLPETITVYRGVNKTTGHPINGMSWTGDIEQAEWFANRFSKYEGTVYKLTVPKENVLACFEYEDEYVIDYGYLKKHKNEIVAVD